MSIETTATGSVDKVTQMADILMGVSEPAEKPIPAVKKPPKVESEPVDDQDLEEGSTQSKESTENQDDEDATEESTEEETENEAEDSDEDGELTWGKALGIDDSKIVLDEQGNVKGFKAKLDGEEIVIPTKELIDGWQFSKSNNQKSQAIAAERREFEQVRDTVVNVYTKKLDDVAKLQTFMEQSMMKDFQGVNWEQLRYENPGEYAAMVQDFQLKQAEISNIASAIESERALEQENMTTAQREASNNYMKGQVAKVLEKNPTWEKPEVFKKTLAEFETFINDAYGFSKEDFANIQDARIFEVLKDAKKYREGKTVAEKKMIPTVAKFMKSSGTVKKTQLSKLERLTKLAKSERPGPRKRDLESSAIAELLLGG
jgi:hypothetical protein